MADTRDDESLLSFAVANAGQRSTDRAPLWSHVATLFGLGSTSATLLCVRFGLDPHKEVGGCSDCGHPQTTICECNAKDYGL